MYRAYYTILYLSARGGILLHPHRVSADHNRPKLSILSQDATAHHPGTGRLAIRNYTCREVSDKRSVKGDIPPSLPPILTPALMAVPGAAVLWTIFPLNAREVPRPRTSPTFHDLVWLDRHRTPNARGRWRDASFLAPGHSYVSF